MIKKIRVFLVCIILALSTFVILKTLPIVSAEDSENTWFGYDHVGYYSDALYYPLQNSSAMIGSNFTCPSNGIADNITVFISNYDSSTHVTCAIYNNSSTGGNLVSQTEEKDVGFGQGWVTFDFVGEPTLYADTEYCLVAWGDDGYLRYDENNSHAIIGRYLVYNGTFPAVIGTLTTYDNFVISIYCRYTEYTPNDPPNTPSDPNPANHTKSVDINTYLSWIGGDPNSNDIVTYDIYFGTTSSPPLKKSSHTSTIYDPGVLSSNTKYYWKIVAKDNHGANSTGPVWDFTTINVNQPPKIPYNPTPQNGTIDINIAQDIYWSGGDPDIDDTVTYDVYFGSMLPLQKIANQIYLPGYNPGLLVNGLTYFWYVVARDNHGLSTNGPIWYFTTINATNNPPDKPTINGEINGKAGIEYEYTFISTEEPEEDEISYYIDWGDNTSTGWTRTLPCGEYYNSSHIWSERGSYTIKAKAKDTYDAESDWATLAVSMPKSKSINIPLFLQKLFQRFPFFEKILNQILLII